MADVGVVEQGRQPALGVEDPFEPEQLVFDLVEHTLLFGHREDHLVADRLDAVDEVPGLGPPLGRRRLQQAQHGRLRPGCR